MLCIYANLFGYILNIIYINLPTISWEIRVSRKFRVFFWPDQEYFKATSFDIKKRNVALVHLPGSDPPIIFIS